MRLKPSLTPRQYLIIAHDLIATAVAIVLTFVMRFEGPLLVEKLRALQLFLPLFLIYAGVVYFTVGLHRNKWRFTSVPDMSHIVIAATILAVSLLVLDYLLLSPQLFGTFFFGKITILLYWFLQMVLLGGSRVAYRYYQYAHTLQRAKHGDASAALIGGRAADAEVLLRAMESGAISKMWPAGILSPSKSVRGQAIRGTSVLGDIEDLEAIVGDLAGRGNRVARLLLTPSALSEESLPEAILVRARKLGIAVNQVPALDSPGVPVQLQPVSVEDLLLRPSVRIDNRRLEHLVAGKASVVTGGGGSIGAEICDRVATFGAGRLLVLENSEPALHAVLEQLRADHAAADIGGRVADVRDSARIMRLIAEFKTDLVFHAAALKHVPLLEQDWDEGIKTNVYGSVNVADAAVAAGAAGMVMISTDKAIEPVSVLGATKRLAEMYCAALDKAITDRHAGAVAPRLVSVRFGNVLASDGSVVPKFRARVEAGGPVTVTHPDMVRYFMTIREACDLVVTAATHALGATGRDASVYVLSMGQPVKVLALAERMIRLSGLQPGHDIEIVFSGIRPGERLNEILFASEEPPVEIGLSGIMAANPNEPPMQVLRKWIAGLDQAIGRDDPATIKAILKDAVPEFGSSAA